MAPPNRYQPITHGQVLQRLAKVVERVQHEHDSAHASAHAEAESRKARREQESNADTE